LKSLDFIQKYEIEDEIVKKALLKSEYLKYYENIESTCKTKNLMSKNELAKGFENFLENHILDALHALKWIRNWHDMKIIDIGSGAGLPGIPISIELFEHVSECALVESNEKKIEFLKYTKQDLGLDNVRVIHQRAEMLAHQADFREGYHTGLIRSVGNIVECLELTMPFIMIGGLAILFRGVLSDSDLQLLTYASGDYGGKLEKVVNYSLPNKKNERNLLLIRKEKETNRKYPRKPGILRKQSRIQIKFDGA
jgi:16S rRNA (guanine527-N7)-methyltransferase